MELEISQSHTSHTNPNLLKKKKQGSKINLSLSVLLYSYCYHIQHAKLKEL